MSRDVEFEVLAFPVPTGGDRAAYKAELIGACHRARLLVGDFIGEVPSAPVGTEPDWTSAALAVLQRG